MRMYAWLREPYKSGDDTYIYKIMLYKSDEGISLFGYFSPDAVICSSDLFYDSLEDLYDDWNDLIDEKGWIRLDDPLPDCQHDAFIPLRVKGRNTENPQWGFFETLKDGKWVEYKPV